MRFLVPLPAAQGTLLSTSRAAGEGAWKAGSDCEGQGHTGWKGLRWGLLTWKALLANPRPSCRQTTMASTMPQFSPHTVPHTRDPFLSTSTSTRPS